jgi:Zn-dependent peptidase ImmA (M78 family)
LGLDPIFNLIELLEDNHIKVIEIPSEDSFDGLSAWANNKQVPVIVLNSAKLKSLDRKRFTALHELGHLVLNLEGLTDKEKEKYCHYFAAAMLLPKETLIKEIGAKRHKVLIPELGAIKKQYGISIQAIAYRMKDLEIISESYFKQFMFFISQMGFKTEEPIDFDYMGQEESYRFNQLLLHALAEEHISMSKAAALSNMKLAEFREKNLALG